MTKLLPKTEASQQEVPQVSAETASAEARETQSKQPPKRRNIVTQGMAAAVAVLATACGVTGFSGANARKKPNLKKDNGEGKVGDLGGSGGTITPENPAAQPTNAPTNGPTNGPVVTDDGKDSCSVIGPGILLPPPVAADLDIKFKAYGTLNNAMVVVKSASGKLMANDFVSLVELKENGTIAKVLARRRVNAVDASTKLVIFDGLHFSAAADLSLIIVSGGMAKRTATWKVAFETKIKHPSNSTDSQDYHIVDTVSLRLSAGNTEGYALAGDHGNYYNTNSLVAAMNWPSPSGTVNNGKQVNKGQEDRALKQASMSSTWGLPSSLPASYHICDAFGDPIPGVSSSSNVLISYSVILVYAQDGSHFHRYFFHVG